jgi:hypothetical protein
MRASGRRRYSSYSFTTSSLDGVNGQYRAPAVVYFREKDAPILIGNYAYNITSKQTNKAKLSPNTFEFMSHQLHSHNVA